MYVSKGLRMWLLLTSRKFLIGISSRTAVFIGLTAGHHFLPLVHCRHTAVYMGTMNVIIWDLMFKSGCMAYLKEDCKVLFTYHAGKKIVLRCIDRCGITLLQTGYKLCTVQV